MTASPHEPSGRASRPRIVLTKLRVTIVISICYALAALAGARVFTAMTERQGQVDECGQIVMLFAAVMGIFWIGSLAMLHRRPS